MPDTGFVLAGQGRSINRVGGGGAAWGSPGNITSDNGANASVQQSAVSTPTHWLVADTFDFSSIPAGSTINGIEVRSQFNANFAFGSPNIAAVVIGKDDSTLGTQKNPATAVTTTPTNYDHGGSADLWGLSILDAEVKASTFQVRYSGNSGSVLIFSCDVIWMRVTYTLPTAPLLIPNSFLPFLVR